MAEKKLESNEQIVATQSYNGEVLEDIAPYDEKKLVRRIDLFMLPLLASLPFFNYLDKSSLSFASIMGIIQDLSLTTNQYSWANSIFYFGYLAFTWVASWLFVRLPIGKYVASTLIAWAVLLSLIAACSNFTGLMIVRFFLGAAEASIIPGCSLLTGMWYKREEHPLRHGAWFFGTSLGVMCGGLLAYAIAHISGGIGPWKWLFIIFGLATLVWAIFLLWALPDTPKNARFLSPEQRVQAISRVRENRQGLKNNQFKWYQVRECLLDLNVWLPALISCTLSITNGALNAFVPTILVSFGFDRLQAYLFNIAIGGIHGLFILVASYTCTRWANTRCYVLFAVTSVSLMGSLIVRLCSTTGVRLFGFFCYFAYVPGLSISLSLIASNTAGFTKRSVGTSLYTIMYCAGNIAGPFLFQAKDAPEYLGGYNGIIGCFVATLVFIVMIPVIVIRRNRRRDQVQGRPANAPASHEGDQPLPELNDKTDGENLDFRYVY
ncbi:hypothetical protein PV08_10495 [Exophiala spinifera]|uniref:Major facilitator superfamily (MFS) profile domain-containing protein n=1 Tax=Exophiala spinifera TaxID=91928 RepID=A0A0D2AXK8_9EURO|nr:uncharacterized protein PV08_10495 [Exophiala spinifera]KIW11195.1 hypothetical protein PV08_10495 [Exophiala spinifera]